MVPPRGSRDAVGNDGLPALLRKLRTQAGLSQQALAERALISAQAVSALERGFRRTPYRATLQRIADALELSEETRQALEGAAPRSRGPRRVERHRAPLQNLPRQLTSFLGRDGVVEEILELVAAAPLVSIVGTGGAGKTRTAIEVGRRALDAFPHGVWFVELAPLRDPGLVPHALAAALGVQESPQRSLLETLSAFLAQKRSLIILDNCEHVIAHVRTVAESLLRECPAVALLATSREELGIAGERVYRIPPLSVPEERKPSPAEAEKCGAVALFVDRVQAGVTRFELTAENVKAVVEICRRLDGLPLALELAAARARVLSPQEICDRLDRVFDLLTGIPQAPVQRHRTMLAAIDWSYELLSAQEQLLFERLAIFAGGFTLETASAVCSDATIPEHDVLDLLSSLIGQSLVSVEFTDDGARYHLLDTTRQYALEKLASRGEGHPLSARHALALLRVAARLDREWYDASERAWFRDAEADIDNFRAALDWSLEMRNDLRTGSFLAAALARLWYSLSPMEGRRWVRLAIGSIGKEARGDELSQLHIADAELSGALGESVASLASAEEALRLRSTLDDLQVARAQHAAGSALAATGSASSGEELLLQALATAERLGNRRLQALVLSDLGTVRSRCEDVDGARRFYAEALALYTTLGLERPAASIAGHLAEVEFEAGDPAAALQRAEEARAGHAATLNRRSEAADLTNMAAYLVALGCFDDARSHASLALEALQDVRSPVLLAFVLQHLAAIAALESAPRDSRATDWEHAATLLGFVEARLQSFGACRDYTERQEHDRVVAALSAALGERVDELMAIGAQWSEEAAVALAVRIAQP